MVLSKETSLFQKDSIKEDVDGLRTDVNKSVDASVPVYMRKSTQTPPSKPAASTTIGTSPTADGAWEYVMPYPKKGYYFYTCEQYTQVNGEKRYSDVRELNSESYMSKWVANADSTYIDGGSIYTGSVTANQIGANAVTADKLDATTINASKKLTVGAMTDDDASSILNSNIEMGGRNLLLSTQSMAGHNGAGTISSDTYEDCSVVTITRSDTATADLGVWNYAIDVEPDADYTLSFWAKASADGLQLRSHFYPNAVASGYNSSGRTTTAADGNIESTLSTSWQRYWVVYHTSSSASGKKHVLAGRCHAAGTYYIAGVKFEKGNKASDWSPSPDDIKVQKYITDIDETGINIHPSDSSGNDSLTINSSAIEIKRNNIAMTAITDSDVRIGKADSHHVRVNQNGMAVWTGSESTASNKVAQYGSTTTIGKTSQYNVKVDEDSIGFYNAETEGATITANADAHSKDFLMTTEWSGNDFIRSEVGGSLLSYGDSNAFVGASGTRWAETKLYAEAVGTSIVTNELKVNTSEGIIMNGDVCVPVGKSIFGYTAGYDKVAMLHYDSDNNTVVGYGNKSTSRGDTYVEGNKVVLFSNSGSFLNSIYGTAITSDRRLKKDIKPIDENVLAMFMDLEPVEFRAKKDTADFKHLGFIAQDVEQAFLKHGVEPKAYSVVDEFKTAEETTAHKYLRYEEFIPLCVKMIQEQQKEIEELKKRVESLSIFERT